jgi:hypothetical protein
MTNESYKYCEKCGELFLLGEHYESIDLPIGKYTGQFAAHVDLYKLVDLCPDCVGKLRNLLTLFILNKDSNSE